jgi:hypothetical protein
VNTERLADRLRRLEQQIRVFKELHGNELQLIQDELADINAELASVEGAVPPRTPEPVEGAVSPRTPGLSAPTSADPAAGSPKRAKWLAEQEKKSQPISRRELLRGREEEG